MKGYAMAISLVVIALIAIGVLAIAYFVGGKAKEGIFGASKTGDRYTLCMNYIGIDSDCDGERDKTINNEELRQAKEEAFNDLKKEIANICSQEGGYPECEVSGDSIPKACIRSCCSIACPG